MNDIQGWYCSGTLKEDAKLKYTPSGFPILDFQLHSQRSYTIKDTVREEFLISDCTILGKDGERLAPQMKTGARVMVRGRWRLNQWTDKEGRPRSRHVATVDEVDLLSVTQTSPGMGAQAAEPDADGSSMPF